MIIPVIMAGGVGSRLWPASREARPKQFLPFSASSTLFQQSLQRLQGLDKVLPPIVVCNNEHRFLVAEQLREIGISEAVIILEPQGRNTAPAVALAALAARQLHPEACLLVLAADHLIANVDEFQQRVRSGQQHACKGALVTFGIVPDRAETGFGYIRRAAPSGDAFVVGSFVEKPDLATAESYLASGNYYWNSGMFMFRSDIYLAELQEFEPLIASACENAWQHCASDLDFKRVPAEDFMQAPAISIDYAVMERTSHAVVVPLDAGWTDLGAWSAVWEQGPKDADNNVAYGDVLFHDSANSFVQADSRLVTLVGMDHAVVVETSDAVLVADKARVQEVKEIVKTLNQLNRPEAVQHRKVYRPWGSYETLNLGDQYQVKLIVVNPGAALSLQLHHKRAEHWVVIQGSATVTRDEEQFVLQENQSTYIPIGVKHRLANQTDQEVRLIEVQCGTYLGEDDIVRFEDVYGRDNQE